MNLLKNTWQLHVISQGSPKIELEIKGCARYESRITKSHIKRVRDDKVGQKRVNSEI